MKIVNSNYINGEFKKIYSNNTLIIKNPTNEEKIAKIYLSEKKELNEAVKSAKNALITFSKTTIKERQNILQSIHDELIKNENELNDIATIEYGAPINTTKKRTRSAIKLFLALKDELEKYDFEKRDNFSITIKEGVGVIGAIIPWNACYAHMCGNIAPAIAMGCTIVIKPSELNALEVEIFMKCLSMTSIPKGVVNIVNGSGENIGNALVKHKDINAISFIGSSRTGKIIYKNASKTIKRITLELGGKSPTIFLEDADFKNDITKAISAAFSNSGQACHAGSRLIVPKTKLIEIENLLIENIKKLQVGDPKNEDVEIGPMINQHQFDVVQEYIKSGIDEGAKLLCGGLGKVDGFKNGYFVKPTVFVCDNQNYKIIKEEIFGPVLCVLTYDSETEALEIANNTNFGLSSYVFSKNEKRALEFAKNIKTGRVLINTSSSKANYPPFGGMKESGLGRMGGKYSMDEFSEIKSILF